MAKAASPIRLQENLMQEAALTGRRFHRSAAEQIEYWAELGKWVSAELDPDVLLSVSTGLAQLKVESVYGAPVNPDGVLQALEHDRKQGVLSETVTSSVFRYQASRLHPGYLERISPDGAVTVGQFQNGLFTALTEARS